MQVNDGKHTDLSISKTETAGCPLECRALPKRRITMDKLDMEL